ncbi:MULTISPECIES: hypothetical protein [unclassified Inquilinus]|uniref:hypothetical protein n=1 Tax=unclassified Inquilinus TaxID=2645927 RepID=UPI003F8F57F5
MLKHLTRVALVAAALTIVPVLTLPAQAGGWESTNQPRLYNPHDGHRHGDNRYRRHDDDRRDRHWDRHGRRYDHDRHRDRDRDRNDSPSDFLQDLFN